MNYEFNELCPVGRRLTYYCQRSHLATGTGLTWSRPLRALTSSIARHRLINGFRLTRGNDPSGFVGMAMQWNAGLRLEHQDGQGMVADVSLGGFHREGCFRCLSEHTCCCRAAAAAPQVGDTVFHPVPPNPSMRDYVLFCEVCRTKRLFQRVVLLLPCCSASPKPSKSARSRQGARCRLPFWMRSEVDILCSSPLAAPWQPVIGGVGVEHRPGAQAARFREEILASHRSRRVPRTARRPRRLNQSPACPASVEELVDGGRCRQPAQSSGHRAPRFLLGCQASAIPASPSRVGFS